MFAHASAPPSSPLQAQVAVGVILLSPADATPCLVDLPQANTFHLQPVGTMQELSEMVAERWSLESGKQVRFLPSAPAWAWSLRDTRRSLAAGSDRICGQVYWAVSTRQNDAQRPGQYIGAGKELLSKPLKELGRKWLCVMEAPDGAEAFDKAWRPMLQPPADASGEHKSPAQPLLVVVKCYNPFIVGELRLKLLGASMFRSDQKVEAVAEYVRGYFPVLGATAFHVYLEENATRRCVERLDLGSTLAQCDVLSGDILCVEVAAMEDQEEQQQQQQGDQEEPLVHTHNAAAYLMELAKAQQESCKSLPSHGASALCLPVWTVVRPEC